MSLLLQEAHLVALSENGDEAATEKLKEVLEHCCILVSFFQYSILSTLDELIDVDERMSKFILKNVAHDFYLT